MNNKSAHIDILKKSALTSHETKLLKKWKNSKILQWIFLFIIMIIFLCIMGYWVIGEISLGFSTDIVIEILLFLFFLYIPIVCIKRIHILSELNINEIKVFRAIITEKKSVRSGEVITRKRNRFVAAKITDSITLYANCSSNIYKKAIVNKTKGLFFTVGDGIMRVMLL